MLWRKVELERIEGDFISDRVAMEGLFEDVMLQQTVEWNERWSLAFEQRKEQVQESWGGLHINGLYLAYCCFMGLGVIFLSYFL